MKLSADSLAVMIISLLATENLSEVDQRMVRLCSARPNKGSTCAIRGAKSFRQAVTTLFTDPSFSRDDGRLVAFSVEKYRLAKVFYSEPGTAESRLILFLPASERSTRLQMIKREASVSSELVRFIVDDLSALLPDPSAEKREKP